MSGVSVVNNYAETDRIMCTAKSIITMQNLAIMQSIAMMQSNLQKGTSISLQMSYCKVSTTLLYFNVAIPVRCALTIVTILTLNRSFDFYYDVLRNFDRC